MLASIEACSFWFVSRNELLFYLLDRFFPNSRSMLEVGCGTGFVLDGFARHRPSMKFFGAEAYLSGLTCAIKRIPRAEFAQMDACQIPFSEEFDIAGAFDVLEHIQDDRRVLKEINRALLPSGGLILTVPQHQWLWTNTDELSGHKRRYTRSELRRKIEAAGFKVLMMTSFICLLLPLMLVLRSFAGFCVNRLSSEFSGGLRLPKSINHMFKAACALELCFVKLRIPLPLGGSLVCVARKR